MSFCVGIYFFIVEPINTISIKTIDYDYELTQNNKHFPVILKLYPIV